MKSYSYIKGAWTPIDDKFKEGVGFTDYDDQQALMAQGFGYSPTELVCKVGSIKIWSRNPVKLAVTSQTSKSSYDFLCLLRVAGSIQRIWISDLPSLIQFTKEIEVYDEDSDLSHLIGEVRNALDMLTHSGYLDVKVTTE